LYFPQKNINSHLRKTKTTTRIIVHDEYNTHLGEKKKEKETLIHVKKKQIDIYFLFR